MILSTVNKTIELLCKLHNILQRSALVTIYKAFSRRHLYYGDIIYDQAHNATFHQKLEQIQYNACLAITGAIRVTSKEEKFYEELGLESLQNRLWYKKLPCFFKFYKNKFLWYLFTLIPVRILEYTTNKSMQNISFFKITHSFLKNFFFPPTILEWNNLDQNIRNSSNLNIFRNEILKFIRPTADNVFNSHNPKGIKFITRLGIGLTYLREPYLSIVFKIY